MVRTKQKEIVRYGKNQKSDLSNRNSSIWDPSSQQSDENMFNRKSDWDSHSQQSAVNMFSQNPQIGSQMPVQRLLHPLVPYDDSSRENSQSQNTIPKFSQRRHAVIEEYSQREQKLRKTKRRCKPGTKALAEIRKFQKSTALLIQRAPFLRVVKDLLRQVSRKDDLRIQSDAVSALQEASEAFIVTLFEAANLCARHGRRVTVMPQDFHLVREILSLFNGGFGVL